MSGGSLDYVYYRVEDAADAIKNRSNDPLHLAFAEHLILISKALHDIEWVFSGDYGEGDDIEAIKKCLSNPKEASLNILKKQANDVIEMLKKIEEI